MFRVESINVGTDSLNCCVDMCDSKVIEPAPNVKTLSSLTSYRTVI